MNIYTNNLTSEYKPTWLYIKQHNITGLKYFGKTTSNNPDRYLGSGKIWKRHLKVHSKDISTIWCQLFNNEEELVKYALKFSIENNIVESTEWANLKLENGLDGGAYGKVSDITRHKHSLSTKGIPKTPEHRRKISEGQLGQKRNPHTPETKLKMSNARKGKPKTAMHNQKNSEGQRGMYWWNNNISQIKSRISPGPEWNRGTLTKNQKITLSQTS